MDEVMHDASLIADHSENQNKNQELDPVICWLSLTHLASFTFLPPFSLSFSFTH